MEKLKNPEITQNVVIKLYKEKGCYDGFAYIGNKELIDTNKKVDINIKIVYYLLIYKHLLTGQIFGTAVKVTTSSKGIGYSALIQDTTRLTDLE